MKVGLFVDMRNPPSWERPASDLYASMLELLSEADSLGASTVWLSEHHFFADGYLPQPLVLASAIAARTSRLRIGTGVLLLPLHSALEVAEQATVVDLVSRGRLDLGFGVGYRQPEFEAFGQDISHRYELVEARIQSIRELLGPTGAVTPKPQQHPIPMWGGFRGVRGARIAARNGLGLLSIRPDAIAAYRRALADIGQATPGPVKGELRVFLSNEPDECRSIMTRHIRWQRDTYDFYRVEGTGQAPPKQREDRSIDELASDGAPTFQVLTPGDANDFVRRYTAGSDVDEVFLWLDVAGAPTELVQEHMRLALTELAPLLADV